MKWVLIDMSFMAHRARHSLRGLKNEDIPTGVLFGFFSQLRAICTRPEIKSNRVLIMSDSKTSKRQKRFPFYKEKRRQNRTDEEREAISLMYDQVRLLEKEILPAIGFPVYRQAGLEADDLLAQAALQLTDKGREGVIVSADSDLLQCLSPHVSMFDPRRSELVTLRLFEERYGLSPQQFMRAKCIAGDTSDNIPGVEGVGLKIATQFLRRELKPGGKRYQAIISPKGKEIEKRNRKLVKLPYRATKRVKIRRPTYDTDAFWAFCERYGMALFQREQNAWNQFFRGHKVRRRR